MAEEMTIRLARPGDYNDVMAIHTNVYNGADYLPFLYHKFMEDPDMIMCVAEIDNKLVSLSSITSIFNGEGGLDCMSRTNELYQKRSIHSRLRKHKIDLFLRLHPGVTSILYAAVESDFHIKRLQEDRFSLLARANLFRIATDTSLLRRELDKNPDGHNDTQVLTPDLLSQLDITDVIRANYFFLGPMWTPHRPNKRDILEILPDHSGLATFSPHHDETAACISKDKADGIKQIVALSFFYPVAIQDSRCCHFFFFGNIDSFLQHFSVQLMKALGQKLSSERNILIYVHFPEEITVDSMKGILKGFAGPEPGVMKTIIVKEDISSEYGH